MDDDRARTEAIVLQHHGAQARGVRDGRGNTRRQRRAGGQDDGCDLCGSDANLSCDSRGIV
jgi:hypothetical protein